MCASVSHCVGAAEFESRLDPSERGCVDLPRHVFLSHPNITRACWSAVGLLPHLVVIFGYSCLCFWAAASASRCVGLLTLNSGRFRAGVGALTCHVTSLSLAPTSHVLVGLQWDYCPIWLSYSGTPVYASGLQYQ